MRVHTLHPSKQSVAGNRGGGVLVAVLLLVSAKMGHDVVRAHGK